VDRAPLAGKDPTVGELVDRLASDLGAGTFVLVDYWADLTAIGLARPNDHDVLVYVAVIVDEEGKALDTPDRYFYECESPSVADKLGYHVVSSADRVSYEEIVQAAARHLTPSAE
jgi:hypothetical protein